MDKKVKVDEKIGGLAMHSAVAVAPLWLTKRSSNTDYWLDFHKWTFSTSDPLTVVLY